jgi:peptidoglycan/xylan/chitin deacetylase (PgdA/CDA1 family)
MYHRVVSAHCPVPGDNVEEAHYAVAEQGFGRQLDAITASGRTGVSLRDIHTRLCAGDEVPPAWIGITFDDGNQSDYAHAMPMLLDRGFSATFFVCTNRLGAPGGLTEEELRIMHENGLHIGAHGVTHRFLTTLDDAAEEHELRESRDVLAAITGAAVDHFAPPGGRYSSRTLRLLDGLGYLAAATSDVGFNSRSRPSRVYKRVAVLQSTSDDTFHRLISGAPSAILPEYVRWLTLRLIRSVLGESRYRRLRSMRTDG